MQAGISSAKHIKQVYKAIKMFHPSVLEDIKPKLITPVPVLIHTILLPALLTKFCQLKGVAEKEVVGIWKGRERADSLKHFLLPLLSTCTILNYLPVFIQKP